jgi:hypothetical protein
VETTDQGIAIREAIDSAGTAAQCLACGVDW